MDVRICMSKKDSVTEPMTVQWKNSPDAHDYPAAANYLSLITGPENAKALADKLKAADLATFKAKDILRSSRLPLLPMDDPHVLIDLRKVAAGVELSPVLLIRGDLAQNHLTQIADGYHRVCASYHLSENTDIPVRIVDAG